MRVFAALMFVMLVYLQVVLWFGKGGIRDVRRLEIDIAAQSAEIAHLKERNQALAAEVRDLKQGIEAIEEVARSEMGMIKRGEKYFQMIKPPPSSLSDPLATHE